MIDVGYSYQQAGYATPGGTVIPMPESNKIYSGVDRIADEVIVDAVEVYSNILRHSEERIPFSEFLLTKLNNDRFFKTYPRGLFIENKEYVKELVRENIPGDVADKYWDINRQIGVSYVPVKEFNSIKADRINHVIDEVKSLESVLEDEVLPRVPEALQRDYEEKYGDEADIYLNRDFNGTFRVY